MIKTYNNKIRDQEVLVAKDSGKSRVSKAHNNEQHDVCSVTLIFRPLSFYPKIRSMYQVIRWMDLTGSDRKVTLQRTDENAQLLLQNTPFN